MKKYQGALQRKILNFEANLTSLKVEKIESVAAYP